MIVAWNLNIHFFMNWQSGNININANIHYPSDNAQQNSYLVGTSLLLQHKNNLFQSDDPYFQDFISKYEKIIPYTMLDYDRAFMLYQIVLLSKNLVGCTAECGVYKGGSSILIASLLPEKIHFALDTYEGMPDTTTSIDGHQYGDLAPPETYDIDALFKTQPNICKAKGLFSQTFPKIKNNIFSFVYVDADLYQSTLECCEFFYPRLTFGGMMLFDDYLQKSTRGVKKAVDEFFRAQKTRPIVLPTNQVIIHRI
jgi:hypothetical protein